MYTYFFKRFLDLIIAIVSIICLLPVLIITSFIIYIQDWHTPIFVQYRIGRDVKKFKIFKFRSMPVNTKNVESNEVNEIKITKFGKFIRRTNVDELPQLFNILFGDMSIVGPRPCIPSQEDLISLRLKGKSYECRPGLTGLSQVNSYDNMPNEVKAKFDNLYASKISFINDTKIILATFIYLTKKPPTY